MSISQQDLSEITLELGDCANEAELAEWAARHGRDLVRTLSQQASVIQRYERATQSFSVAIQAGAKIVNAALENGHSQKAVIDTPIRTACQEYSLVFLAQQIRAQAMLLYDDPEKQQEHMDHLASKLIGSQQVPESAWDPTNPVH